VNLIYFFRQSHLYTPIAGDPDEFIAATFVSFTSTSTVAMLTIDYSVTIANGIKKNIRYL